MGEKGEAMPGSWREKSRRTIAAVRAQHPELECDPVEMRRVVNAAYPFGPRRYLPYKMWLEELRRAVAEVRSTTDDVAVCDVARDLVEEGREADAIELLKQAPSRLAGKCPACGSAPGYPCRESPADDLSAPLMKTERPHARLREMIVPHASRLVVASKNGPLFAQVGRP